MKKTVCLALTVFLAVSVWGDQKPIVDAGARFHPVIGSGGMVVSQEQLASRVGADILARGGNAVDAAVATGFALAVTLPQAGNIGGGGFMLVYLAEEDRTIAIDYREMAPGSAHRSMYLAADGEVDNEKSRYSVHAAGVPGTVAGLLHAQENYGNLTLKEVIQPAIKLAADGFAVSHTLANSLAYRAENMLQDKATANYFYHRDGTFYQPGERLVQADLAASLQRIADKGGKGFYHGKTAELMLAKIRRGGGEMTQQDLLDYRVIERKPVCGEYRDHRVCAMPPPSSGGIHLIQMLNILEGWELQPMGHNSAAYLHRLIEVMRRAYADRSEYLGDPDFYPVPVTALIDKPYAEKLRRQIDEKKASRSADIKPGLRLPKESRETTHYSSWDKWGNVVSNTYTLNFSFGSGISVDGAGFLLNNEMDDFAAKPGTPNAYGLVGGDANAIAGGKRPLSSMTPTIVFKQGVPVIATGSPGGSTIITVVLQQLLNLIDFEMNLAEATAAPRIHHQWLPDQVWLEEGISPDTETLLRGMGHDIQHSRVLGRTQSLMKDAANFYGVSDYRWPGGAAVPVSDVANP